MRYRIFISLLVAGLFAGFSTLRAQDCATGYCPESVTFHHFIDGISPETVTITYPVVETTLGSTNSTNACWLAQNLGATTQPSSATDNSDAAAGWYWQFNRKQGYAYNSSTSTRTPATTWESYISEATDWLAENDPCVLLLGGSWRLPTRTEWTNADANGSIGGYTTAYNSVLKLHAAGYLYRLTGILTDRGSIGDYYSSTSGTSTLIDEAYFFYSASGGADVRNNEKAFAFPLRCIMNL